MLSAGEMIPKIGVYTNYGDYYDGVPHLMHISTGSFMVNLVGEKSDAEFDGFAKHCYTEGLGLPIFVGSVQIKS